MVETDFFYTVILPLGIGLGSIIIWEAAKFFISPKYYRPLTKFKRKYHLRKTHYPTKVIKSYDIITDEKILPIIREKVEGAFKDFDIEFFESKEYNLAFQILKEKINCKFYIDVFQDEEDAYILLKVNSDIHFKELKDGLAALFWGITDFYESLNNYITQESNEVKVKIDIKEMNLISELFEESESTVIVSKNISLQKEHDHTKLILSGRRGPELANKIRNIIILGSFQ